MEQRIAQEALFLLSFAVLTVALLLILGIRFIPQTFLVIFLSLVAIRILFWAANVTLKAKTHHDSARHIPTS